MTTTASRRHRQAEKERGGQSKKDPGGDGSRRYALHCFGILWHVLRCWKKIRQGREMSQMHININIKEHTR